MRLVCTVWQSLSKLWWTQGEITPEKPNFTPHKTVHQAANCYSECILSHLPSEAVKPRQYHRHLYTSLKSVVTQSMSRFSVQPEPSLASTVRSFYWTRPHFTECGLKPLMQPSLCLHLPSLMSQPLSLHILHFPPSLHLSVMFSSFIFTLHLPCTFTTPFSFPSFSFILLPFSRLTMLSFLRFILHLLLSFTLSCFNFLPSFPHLAVFLFLIPL